MDDNEQQKAAVMAAFDAVRMLWTSTEPVINPGTPLKQLSSYELGWIVNMAISQWITTRARQVSTIRGAERLIRTLDSQIPEPWERGAILAVLPQLADWIGENELTDKPIGAWDRDAICMFAWIVYRLVDGARVVRDEMPGDVPFDPPQGPPLEADMLEAG
jgi:hypothetical protein